MGERTLVKDLVPVLDDHGKRIEKLEKSKDCFDDHLQKHADVYDEKLKNHQEVLFGVKGDDGLVFDVKQIIQMKKNLNNLTWAVITAIVIEVALRLLK
ncbi:MAG TPA: hypothetical protein PLL88_06625 [Anaerolineaceae bacterium]|nr:hypothetical protein [Anaerolineaceae bacterium]